jgi:hypothetical protein
MGKRTGGMVMIQSDYDDITIFIIDECKKIHLDLNESARKMLISKAVGIFINQGLRIMREQIAWEIKLLAPTMIERGTDRDVEICKRDKMKQEKRVASYLAGIGLELLRNSKIYFTVVPKSYDMARIKSRIVALQTDATIG